MIFLSFQEFLLEKNIISKEEFEEINKSIIKPANYLIDSKLLSSNDVFRYLASYAKVM